jgi:hypothetical protein
VEVSFRAALRSAAAGILPLWRKGWWVLAPAIIVWTAAMSPLHAGLWTILAVLSVMAASAVQYRYVLGRSDQGVASVVLRVGGAWILTLVFMVVLGSLLFVVFLSSAYAVASAGPGFVSSDVRSWASAVDGRGKVVLAFIGMVGLAWLAWALTRVSLAAASTVARGKLQVLSAWPLTRRLAWRLLLVRLAIVAPFAILCARAWRASTGSGPTTEFGAWILSIAAAVLLIGVWLPLNTGLMSYIYQSRAGD